ncbi:MAG TPA: arsenite methyltransferase [Deltaproteobacteria bacterium]|nr:arsenite methyltransferase [Deltaproteobacteria bacterium]
MKKHDQTAAGGTTQSRTQVSCCGGTPFSLDRQGRNTSQDDPEMIRNAVRDNYAKVATTGISCCGSAGHIQETGRHIGYTDEEMHAVPEGSNLGLGCGNPTAIASLKQGETVIDLGSGGGFDCFLASSQVGPGGRVIGVDMTADMLSLARDNARKGGYGNVEFRLGEIENLPVADNTADVVISNCVINLSPDKNRVFREAFRALKPGGRLMVSDIVLLSELPEEIRSSVEAYVGCVAGAVSKDAYLAGIRDAGFKDVNILKETGFPFELLAADPLVQSIAQATAMTREEGQRIADSILSISVYAKKP